VKRASDAARPGPEQSRRYAQARRTERVVEALRLHQQRAAAALFALFVLAYLWPVLLAGDVLSPASVLYGVPPWAAFRPAAGINYYNFLLSDFATSYYPWDVLARQMIHSGTFPAWNPHALAGTPFFANPGIGWLGPFMLPLWLLPLNYGLGVAAALKLWIAAFGTYLLVRELRLGFWAGVLAGVSFALCAFDVVWLSHGAHVAVAVWLPWLVLLAERIVRRGRGREGVLLAVVVAMAAAGGHPGTQVHVLAGTLLYALVRAATGTDVAWSERLRRLGLIAAGMALGILCMAVVLLPGKLAAAGTMGRAVRRNGGSDALIGHILPLSALRTALFPDWWGRPSEALLSGPANYNERTFYAGGVALVLALVALVSPGAWRRKVAFLPLAAIGLAVPLNAPLIHDAVVHLPAFDSIQNQRLLLWFAFAVAILAAFGLQALLDAPRRQARAWAVVCAGALAGGVAIATLALAPGDLGRALQHLGDRFAGVTPGALALASVLRWLLLVAVAAAALVLLRVRPRQPWLAGSALALVAALDMLLFAHAYQPMGPPSIVFPPRTPAVAFLQRHSAQGRIVGVRSALFNDYSGVYGLRDVRGHDVPQPSLRFYRLWRLVQPEQDMLRGLDVSELSPAGVEVLSLLGARYIVTDPGVAVPSGVGLEALTYAYRGAEATVLEDPLAAPRALVAQRIRVMRNEDQELATVARAGFDPRREAVVPRDGLHEAALPLSGPAAATVRVTGEQDARVTLRARLAHRGLVVLDDAWAPGWSVTVDGRPAHALRTDVVMRGVVVPAGEHTIAWRYRVPGLRLGALLSGLGLLALLAWAGILLVRTVRARLERLQS
jgi:hypothetical protein